MAGFISVFASELSIFTLTVITLERWYAITYAIHLNRRLKLGVSVKIMMSGWLYALLMASLPLVGVSSYSKTSICLPMEHARPLDLLYLLVILSINAVAFLLISSCYGKVSPLRGLDALAASHTQLRSSPKHAKSEDFIRRVCPLFAAP